MVISLMVAAVVACSDATMPTAATTSAAVEPTPTDPVKPTSVLRPIRSTPTATPNVTEKPIATAIPLPTPANIPVPLALPTPSHGPIDGPLPTPTNIPVPPAPPTPSHEPIDGTLTGWLLFDPNAWGSDSLPEDGYVEMWEAEDTEHMRLILRSDYEEPLRRWKALSVDGPKKSPSNFWIKYAPQEINPDNVYFIVAYFEWVGWRTSLPDHPYGCRFLQDLSIEYAPPLVLTGGHPTINVHVRLREECWQA